MFLLTDLSIASAIDSVDKPASDMPIMRFRISTLVSNVPFAFPPFFFFLCDTFLSRPSFDVSLFCSSSPLED